MSESFDYVAFARDFEKRHGRPPTAEELEKANVSVATVITSDNQKIDFRMVDSLDYVEGYKDKSSFGERLKTGLSFVIRNFFRVLLIVIQTPVYLTLFFFNLIKSTIGVFVIWFVSKFVLGWLVGIIAGLIYGFDLYKNPFPSPIKDIVDFSFGVNWHYHRFLSFSHDFFKIRNLILKNLSRFFLFLTERRMMKDILSELTKGLGSYNSSVNNSMTAINKSLMAIGYILVSILFLLELLSWYRFIRNQGGEMTWKLFLEVAVKYFIAYFLVSQSGAILNAILWFTNGVTKLIGVDLSGDNMFEFVWLKKGNLGVRILVNGLAAIAGVGAMISIKVMVLLRFIELYFYKAIAPVIVAFWMGDDTRHIAKNFLKTFGAIALQSAVIVLLLAIWQGLNIDAVIKISKDSWVGAFAAGFSYIGKCIVFLILLFGSQRKAKQLLQVS